MSGNSVSSVRLGDDDDGEEYLIPYNFKLFVLRIIIIIIIIIIHSLKIFTSALADGFSLESE